MTRNRFSPALFTAVSLLIGCSEELPEAITPETDEETPAAVPADPAAPPTGVQREEVSLRRPGLPEDVFFDDPLAIAANRTRLPGAGQPARQAIAEPMTDVGPAPEVPGGQEAVDWAAILPADLLVAEVNRIRERFAPKLASVATFNNSLLDFPPYAAELAALGGIATEHSGGIPWKKDAKYVRDLASSMLSEQLQRGQKSYEQVKQPFDRVSAILDGKRPQDLAGAEDQTDFSASADFGYLMRRFEASQNLLRTTGGSEAAFKQNASDLARETRVVAALSRVVADDDYGWSADPPFAEYAAGMTGSALDAAAAAESGEFQKFDAAVNALNQSCVRCHGEYRNN